MNDNTYLLIVDMQRVFAETTPWHVPDFYTVQKTILDWYDVFDMDHVIFSAFVPDPHPKGAWRDYYDRYPFAQRESAKSLFELAEPYASLPGSRVTASTFSKWPAIQDLTMDKLYICGVSTGCCVLSTAMAAADAGVSVSIIRDGCAAVSKEMHDAVEAVVRNYPHLINWV